MKPNNLGDQLQVKDVKPIAAITSTAVGSAIDLVDLDGEVALMLDVSAPVAGTNPTLDVKLTECDTSGGSYTDVASGAFTQVTSAASAQKLSLNKDELKRYVKLSWTIGGTSSPQYLVSSKLVGINKYAS